MLASAHGTQESHVEESDRKVTMTVFNCSGIWFVTIMKIVSWPIANSEENTIVSLDLQAQSSSLLFLCLGGASSGLPFHREKAREARPQETVFNMNWLKVPEV